MVLATAALCSLAATETQAMGKGKDGRWYVAGSVAYFLPNESSVTGHDVEYQAGYAASLSGGYYLTPHIRGELEVFYGSTEIDGATDSGNNKVTASGDANFGAVMLNAIAEFGDGDIHPYLGGGLGVGMFELDSVSIDSQNLSAEEAVLTYQLIAGAAYDVNPDISVTFDYRYRGSTDAEATMGTNTTTEIRTITSHNFLLGMRYAF